jgi:diacylglycerol kinase (ATP)
MPKRDKSLILFNPSAGGGKAMAKKTQLEKILLRHGVRFEMVVTESELQLRELSAKAARAGRMIVGAGGDSTFHIMVNEIMAVGSGAPLGLIGLGSSNDIALEFGLETMDKAALALENGRLRKIDLGIIKAGKEKPIFFLGQANIGLGAAVNRYIADLAAKRSPWAGFQTAAGVRGIINAYRKKTIPLALDINAGIDAYRGSYVLGVFSNIRYWATGKIMCPGARPNDGLLDACLFRECSFARLARLNALANRGQHGSCREVEMLQSPSFEVTSQEPFFVQTDGEILSGAKGPLTLNKVRFEIAPYALNLIA